MKGTKIKRAQKDTVRRGNVDVARPSGEPAPIGAVGTLQWTARRREVRRWRSCGPTRAIPTSSSPRTCFDRSSRRSWRHGCRGASATGDDEIVHVDGQSFPAQAAEARHQEGQRRPRHHGAEHPPTGARDIRARLADLDQEGVWGEVIYPSLGLWNPLIKDPELVRTASRAENEWIASEIQASRPTAWCPQRSCRLLTVQHAVDEVYHVAEIGLHAVSLPTGLPEGVDDYNRDSWNRSGRPSTRTGLVLSFHIGSDGSDTASMYRGPGGAVLNYVETTFGGQRSAMKMVTSGALDRHPTIKVLVSEGGATWVPFIGDRMNEGYRQHGMFVRPTLSAMPKEILYRQVYASFQHDESAVGAYTAMGYRNVLWGSDYPHLEGTFGHTQKTLHELFDGVARTCGSASPGAPSWSCSRTYRRRPRRVDHEWGRTVPLRRQAGGDRRHGATGMARPPRTCSPSSAPKLWSSTCRTSRTPRRRRRASICGASRRSTPRSTRSVVRSTRCSRARASPPTECR